MLKIAKIIDKSLNGFIRKFKIKLYGINNVYAEQYHGGGDDYNPPEDVKAVSGVIGNNPRDGIIFLYQDLTKRISEQGEKRIYATDVSGKNVVGEIHLKNNGDVIIIPTGKILTFGTIEHTGDLNVSGTVTGGIVAAKNGASGSYSNSVTSENGIVTGGA